MRGMEKVRRKEAAQSPGTSPPLECTSYKSRLADMDDLNWN